MKLASGLCLGLLFIGFSALTTPVHAEGIPRGSYLNTCNGAKVEGASLVAQCRRLDGSEQHSALLNFDRCVGDIVNENGVLNCAFNTATAIPVPTPPGPMGTPVAEHCGELRGEARELRDRLDRAIDPIERARLEGRLREVRVQEERCR